MAIKDCIPEIQALTGGRLSTEQISQIIEELQRRQKERRVRGAAERDDDILMQEAQEMANDIDIAARMEKRNRAINVLAKKRRDEFIDGAIGQGLTAREAIMALNAGIEKEITGKRKSVDAMGTAMFADYLSGMMGEIRRAGLLEHLTRRGGVLGTGRGGLDLDIAREMRAVSAGEGPVTQSIEARGIAEIIHRHQERARQRLNRSGGWVGSRWDYIVGQSHDQYRVMRAAADIKEAKKVWTEFILPLLDHDLTFGGADPVKFLGAAFEGISSGVHLRADGHGANPPEGAFRGPGNLAKRVSAERVLHFKDADGWYAYNERFGTRSLIEAVFSGFETSARATALMETWGTNPRAGFDTTIKELREKHRADPAIIKGLAEVENQFRDIDGTTRQVDNITMAHISSAVGATQRMAKLGAATLSSITDVATAASDLRWQGNSFGAAITDHIGAFFDGLSGSEKLEMAEMWGIFYEGMAGDVGARFSATDNVPGRLAKIQQLYFKANLLTPWTGAVKRAMGRVMARNMSKALDTGYADLNVKFRRMLDAYAIDETDWNVLRQARAKGPDGRDYITPDAIRNLSDEQLAPLTGARAAEIEADIAKRTAAATGRGEANRLRTLPAERTRRLKSLREKTIDRLELSMRTLYIDRVNAGVPTPGTRERAIMHQGTVRGTVEGEFWRRVMDFKSYPITFMTRVLNRDLAGHNPFTRAGREALLRGEGDTMGLVMMMASTTILGMGAMQMKEIVKGRSPRDPFGEKWGEVWTAAMLQGGGAGIFGDFMLGEWNRFGRTPAETFLGPTFGGTVPDAFELLAKLRTGEDLGATGLRIVQNHTPFLNLFYTKLAVEYLFLWQLQEAVNPGYLRRMERRIERENDQTFLIRPSEAVQ